MRPNKKNPVFRVTWLYLKLLVNPRIFLRVSGKNIILNILKGEMPFKMHKIIFFSRIFFFLNMWVPTLPKISDLLPETHLFFYLAWGKVNVLLLQALFLFLFTKVCWLSGLELTKWFSEKDRGKTLIGLLPWKQSDQGLYCLSGPFDRQLVFENLEHLP